MVSNTNIKNHVKERTKKIFIYEFLIEVSTLCVIACGLYMYHKHEHEPTIENIAVDKLKRLSLMGKMRKNAGFLQ